MPVAVAHLEVVLFAVVAFEHVQFGDVEQDALAVSGRDAPLAALALLGHGAGRKHGRRERRLVLLERAAALWSTRFNYFFNEALL